MSLNFNKWLKLFLQSVLTILSTLILINIIVNPYCIFNHNFLNLKKNYLLSDRINQFYFPARENPSTIMMGTSRIGLYKTSDLSKYCEGKVYNAALAGSTIEEQATYLKYYINTMNIKNIIWSLDFFSFNPEKAISPTFSSDRFVSALYFEDYIYATVNFKTFMYSILTIKDNLVGTKIIQSDIDQPFSNEMIIKNIEHTLNDYKKQKAFLKSEVFKNPQSIDKKINTIQGIIEMCNVRNIKLYIYLSPVYYKHLDMIYSMGLGKTYDYLKNELATLTSYYDFSTYNGITENHMNFRDSSHTVSSIGEKIFCTIFDETCIHIYQNFGVYVKKRDK